MEKMAKQFSEYRVSHYTNQPTLAILPFQAEKKLSERGIGIAIGEMLTSYVLTMKSFKIVERAELKKVLEEQKLGLTGAIESSTAISVGHILGCQIIVVGNVVRLGENYQISARMIDVLTGEVLTVAFTEVDSSTLDEQAKKYVLLVPETEIVGIYIGYFTPLLEGRPITTNVGMAASVEGVNFFHEIGIGARYFPLKWLFVDVSYVPAPQAKTVHFTLPQYSGNGVFDFDYSLKLGDTYTASINFAYSPVEHLRTFLGYGLIKSSMALDFSVGGITYVFPSGTLFGTKNSRKNFALNFLDAGIEYRPLQRFGISFAINYFQGNLPQMDIATDQGKLITLFEPKLHKITNTVMTSLYF